MENANALRIAQRQLHSRAVKTLDRPAIQFRQQIFRRVGDQIDELSVQRFGFRPGLAVDNGRFRELHVSPALRGVAAQKRRGIVQYFFLQRFVHLQRNSADGQQWRGCARVRPRSHGRNVR